MATIQEALVSVLEGSAAVAALVGDRIYPEVAEQGAPLPRVTYQRVSALRSWDMGGPSGLVESRFQFDAWGDTYARMVQLVEAIRTALDGFAGAPLGVAIQLARLVDDAELDEPTEDAGEKSIPRTRLDFLVTYEESRPNHLFGA